MKTWIALFRGINVGGKNKLAMKDLRALVSAQGYESVKTYIQSGNMVFQSSKIAAMQFEAKVKKAILKDHGFQPKIMVLSQDQLTAAQAQNPFAEATREPKTLHLYFLAEPASDADLECLESLKKDSEHYRLTNAVFYLHAPEGIGRSKLAARVEKALGVAATARNWRSVSKIIDLAASLSGA